METKKTIARYFKIDPKDIVYIKAILESYEGMVVVRTVEVGKPILQCLIAQDFNETLEPVFQELQSRIPMEEVARSETWDSWPL